MACLGQLQAVTLPDIATFTKTMQRSQGYFDYYWDASSGKIWLEIERLDEEFLYVATLPAGIGSNDVGLDRGQLGSTKVVKFSRSGPKILMTHVNYQYRALSSNPAERVSVEQAFAQSIIGGFNISATTKDRVLVDVTDFIIRDAHNYALGEEHSITRRLQTLNQGKYTLDKMRSAIYLKGTRNFPENTEFEASLTFGLKEGESYGDMVASVVPSPESITVRLHHSFVKLPDSNYDMRGSDPRSGYHGISFHDYATPIDQPLKKHFIHRHRLQKMNPGAAISDAVEPIVYYVDPGAPEPIRSALIEGASWWNQAFEVAGYRDAFQVKVLPEDVDPMDIRYNVIQWVHRSTRGWSYGMTVSDPRTGEIIKGHVSLGSLRVRQDFLIAQGLIPGYRDNEPEDPRMLELALARLRQLSAHEVGHTLGLLHNFAASTNNRASVMDYPHPYVELNEQGNMDFVNAYDNKIGEWDKQAIKYGYQHFPEGTNESNALKAVIQQGIDRGLNYITSRDALPIGAAHPSAHLWDNGVSPVAELLRLLEVRNVALQNFGEDNIPNGASWSSLEEVLVPLYLSHRYQIEAASKLIGGVDYNYALKGDGQELLKPVDQELQREALATLIYTLDPKTLSIPEHITELIPPKVPNSQRSRESFKSRAGVAFDPIAAAEGVANTTISLLLHPQRATRLSQQKSLDEKLPGLGEVIDALMEKTWKTSNENAYHQDLINLTAQLFLNNLLLLTLNEEASIQVRAAAHSKVLELESWLRQSAVQTPAKQRLMQYALRQIRLYNSQPESLNLKPSIQMPDGSPIGMEFGCTPQYY
jgi:hypothetical protein